MNREIKFRALFRHIASRKEIWMQSVVNHTVCESNGYTQITPWLQYTGLLDIGEKEIYEGDIVYLAGYGDYKVEFPFIDLYEALWHDDIGDIIGNIYENPELLKE